MFGLRTPSRKVFHIYLKASAKADQSLPSIICSNGPLASALKNWTPLFPNTNLPGFNFQLFVLVRLSLLDLRAHIFLPWKYAECNCVPHTPHRHKHIGLCGFLSLIFFFLQPWCHGCACGIFCSVSSFSYLKCLNHETEWPQHWLQLDRPAPSQHQGCTQVTGSFLG